jgi:hypothetical protein
MLKDYEFDDDDYKPDELQNDGVVMLKGILLAFLILKLYYFRQQTVYSTNCLYRLL